MATTHIRSKVTRLQELLLEGHWVANTNFKKVISNVDWHQAIKTVGPHNSIALLTFHITYYLEGLNQVFSGGSLDIKDKYSFDMPPVTNANDWQDLQKRFISNAETFIQHVANFSDDQLQDSFVEAKYGTLERNIEGVIEHTYYHFGQISLLKKLL